MSSTPSTPAKASRWITAAQHAQLMALMADDANSPGLEISLTSVATGETQTKSSDKKSLNFDQNKPFAVPMKIGTLTLTAKGIPIPPSGQPPLKWAIVRNPQDVFTGLPTLPVNTNQLTNTLDPSLPGSFNIIVYLDNGNDGNYLNGEVLVVLNLAIVQATVQSNTNNVTTGNSGSWSLEQVLPLYFTISSGETPSNMIIRYNVQVLLEGGGEHKQIGLEKFVINSNGKGTVGLIGSVTGINVQASYANGHKKMLYLKDSATLPILDTPPEITGSHLTGWQVYKAGDTGDTITSQTNGALHTITTKDGPTFSSSVFFTGTSGDKVLSVEDGPTASQDHGLAFTDYLADYSTDFPLSYSLLGQVQWILHFKLTITGAVWDISASSITGPGTGTPPTPSAPPTAIDLSGYPKVQPSSVKTQPPLYNEKVDVKPE